ncbi:dual oxidase maturation factor 1-like [Rana temporaria]|uniref:dual oxidase maturation factor 1-like n=1 Tax=Rana temporaria TaxID=8407 RepID=UPI001AAD2E13|nr:dual oxidase maturation factor 1-like [Rana temporaria]
MTFYNRVFPFYPQPRKEWAFNVNCIIVIIVFLVFASAFILIIPGIRGRARISWTFRVLISLFIGAVTVAVNFTADWEVGSINATTTYKSFSSAVVNANIGINVGLSGVNITLKGNPVHQINETIDYNEQFLWMFGSDYDKFYHDGLERGLPNPILYVAEKFRNYDSCGLHNQYRVSGHYASACMWVAFCSWIICNILFSMPVFIYGAYMILVTAAFMLFSLISFSTVKNVAFCNIQFGSESLKTYYGGSFWLTLATGLLCFLIGITVIILNWCVPEKLKSFFNTIEEDEDEPGQLYYTNIGFDNV